jgi:hypothetical protein
MTLYSQKYLSSGVHIWYTGINSELFKMYRARIRATFKNFEKVQTERYSQFAIQINSYAFGTAIIGSW